MNYSIHNCPVGIRELRYSPDNIYENKAGTPYHDILL